MYWFCELNHITVITNLTYTNILLNHATWTEIGTCYDIFQNTLITVGIFKNRVRYILYKYLQLNGFGFRKFVSLSNTKQIVYKCIKKRAIDILWRNIQN